MGAESLETLSDKIKISIGLVYYKGNFIRIAIYSIGKKLEATIWS